MGRYWAAPGNGESLLQVKPAPHWAHGTCSSVKGVGDRGLWDICVGKVSSAKRKGHHQVTPGGLHGTMHLCMLGQPARGSFLTGF